MRYDGVEIEKDWKKALQLYQMSCDKRNRAGCATLANMYRNGEGTEKDAEKSTALLLQACDDATPQGCESLIRDRTPITLQDTLRDALCNRGHVQSCTKLAYSYENGGQTGKDWVKALHYYEKICALEFENSKRYCDQIPKLAAKAAPQPPRLAARAGP